ncbi:sugar-binding transcriptional regulator [Leucobacter musarum]|uniref:sugar-binding transcriptional regulator n=1 Tax=Leucobacter musarum TaxID=1930747 RepID=UPI0006A7C259|nr:sugar-binding domain-containing protein [Leucobacter musarum]
MKTDDDTLAVRAAELYYQDDKNQAEIAAILGINRWKVGRLLSYAKERGYVQIEVIHPRARRLPLERALRDTFGLRDAVVVPQAANERESFQRTTMAAAEFLATMRPVPRSLGISWGRTLQQIATDLPEAWASGIEVIQINGGVTVNRKAGMASSTATTIAQKGGGTVTLLPSPAILEQASTREAIEGDRTVAGILEAAREASAYVFSAGAVGGDSVLVSSGYLEAADLTRLTELGAVGDVLGRYIDADGNIVDPSLNARTLGLTIADLQSADTAIAVISGRAKWPVCRAVVRSGTCSVLVTDEDCATHLLKEHTS